MYDKPINAVKTKTTNTKKYIHVNMHKIRANKKHGTNEAVLTVKDCLLYTSPSTRDLRKSRMPSSS